jgi:hypothetical protein
MADRPENLRSWRPGESGNPAGRPRGASITAAMRRQLGIGEGEPLNRSQAEQIAEQIVSVALDPSHPHWARAVGMILDRTDGPVSREVVAPTILPPKVIQLAPRPTPSNGEE